MTWWLLTDPSWIEEEPSGPWIEVVAIAFVISCRLLAEVLLTCWVVRHLTRRSPRARVSSRGGKVRMLVALLAAAPVAATIVVMLMPVFYYYPVESEEMWSIWLHQSLNNFLGTVLLVPVIAWFGIVQGARADRIREEGTGGPRRPRRSVKMKTLNTTVLLLAGLLASCSDEGVDAAREKTQELVDQGFELFEEQQEEVTESLRQSLEELQQRTGELREAATRETGEAREKLQHKLEELEPYEEKLRAKLEEAMDASQEVWATIEKEAAELQERSRNAWEAFREDP